MPLALTPHSPVAGLPAGPRRRALLGLTLLALLLHAAFVGGIGALSTGQPERADAALAMRARVLPPAMNDATQPAASDGEAIPAADAAPPAAQATLSGSVDALPARRPAAASPSTEAVSVAPVTPPIAQAAVRPIGDPAVPPIAKSLVPPTAEWLVPSAAESVVPSPADPVVRAAAQPPLLSPTTSPAPAARATLLAAGELAPPVYRTALPPSANLHYEARRGSLRGTAEIEWQRTGDDYRLRLEAQIDGLAVLTQTSQGAVDSAGIAPVRFVDQRARRAARAANFQRDHDAVTFSGSSAEWPILPGSQDQLSWIVQLAGIVAADPSLASDGGRVTMVMVGARGDASVRTARFVGQEQIEAADGSQRQTVKFVVDGRATYDTSFEVWLDPARDDLPVRLIQRNAAGEPVLELIVRSVDAQQ